MREKRRIVHLTTVHHPYDPRIYYKQCLSLHKANYDVTLISQSTKNEKKLKMPIRHIPLKTYKSRFKRMLIGTWDAYKKAKKRKADIYVFHDPELLFVAALLKKKDNVVIYDIHEDYMTSILQKNYLPNPVKKIAAKLYTFAEKILTRKMKLSLAEKYYKEIYPSGVCILNYPLLNEKMLEIDRRKQDLVNKVLYTGNVTVERGAHIHAQLPTTDPNLVVQFIGKCAKQIADEMKEIAGDQSMNLHIEGIDAFVVKERIEEMYLSERWLAGIAIFPPTEHYKKKELTKFFEYMNASLPIVCSDFPVWKKFIETYECGIAVNPNDPKEIKAAFETLRNDPELAYRMGERGRQAVIKELNWEVEERKLLTWYDELIKGTC